jgi:hypothetical protein
VISIVFGVFGTPVFLSRGKELLGDETPRGDKASLEAMRRHQAMKRHEVM